MEKRIKELEDGMEGMADLVRNLIMKIGKQDAQLLNITKLFNELLNKTKKEEDGLRNK